MEVGVGGAVVRVPATGDDESETRRARRAGPEFFAVTRKFSCPARNSTPRQAPRAPDDLTLEEWNDTLATNLTSTFLTVKASLPLLTLTMLAVVAMAVATVVGAVYGDRAGRVDADPDHVAPHVEDGDRDSGRRASVRRPGRRAARDGR